jgi:quinoprotein glucose dehydrogenase
MRKSILCILVLSTIVFAADQRAFDTWTGYGGGRDSSQYSSLKQINKSNVKQLEVVWTYTIGAAGSTTALTFDPLVVDETMYVSKSGSIVALDATTGKELWTHMGGPGARGMNYWESKDRTDRRLVFISGGYITEINALTGAAIPSFGDNGRVDPSAESDRRVGRPGGNPGRIYQNTIIVSLPASGAAYDSTPGDVRAYDVLTGKLQWTFHSVPRPGEFGDDTWPKEMLPTAGGVHNWNELTVDEPNGIVFVPFGTARYDFYGGNRHGKNLFANSLVALDAKTGKRIWHFQMIHHDLWDYDLPAAPKLLTVRNRQSSDTSMCSIGRPAFHSGPSTKHLFRNRMCRERSRGRHSPFHQSHRPLRDNRSRRKTSIRIYRKRNGRLFSRRLRAIAMRACSHRQA